MNRSIAVGGLITIVLSVTGVAAACVTEVNVKQCRLGGGVPGPPMPGQKYAICSGGEHDKCQIRLRSEKLRDKLGQRELPDYKEFKQ